MRRLLAAALLLAACSPPIPEVEGAGTTGLTVIGRAEGLRVIRDSLHGVTCWVTVGSRGASGIACIERPDSATPAW